MGRLACWVIVAGAQPTAFRSNEREELVPTLNRLQRTQPDAVLKWFSRGQLWNSPDEAIDALQAKRNARRSPRKEWRPGGAHVDPRAKYDLTRDQKRARFKDRRFGPKPKPKPGSFVRRPNKRRDGEGE